LPLLDLSGVCNADEEILSVAGALAFYKMVLKPPHPCQSSAESQFIPAPRFLYSILIDLLALFAAAARMGLPQPTSEPMLIPVVPHSEGSEFTSQIEKYRGIVEEAVFNRLGPLDTLPSREYDFWKTRNLAGISQPVPEVYD
jgi:hypothetical protein